MRSMSQCFNMVYLTGGFTHALNDVLHAAEREPLGVPLFKLAKDHWYPANIIGQSLQRAGDRWHPVTIRARSGDDQHRGRGAGAQFDVVWNLVDSHRYRYALRESDPLEGRRDGGQQFESCAAVFLGNAPADAVDAALQ